MKILIKRKVNNAVMEVEIEEKQDKDALRKAMFFTAPDYCFECKSEKIVWSANEAKSKKDGAMYTYIKRRCTSCGAQSTAGDYKDGGMFWKRFEIYNADGSGAPDMGDELGGGGSNGGGAIPY